MRPLAVLLILVACQCAHAYQHPRTSREILQNTLQSLLGEHYQPVQRIFSCTHTLGPAKCLSALSVWRAERAIEAYTKDPASRFNLTEDVERFPWIKYSNTTDEQLYTQLYDDTRKLLQYRPLGFNMIPGYDFKLGFKENGTMNFDIYKSDTAESGRSSMKKMQKAFYKYVPFLLIPGLVMSAIFPFILPGLKMMTLMVGMMNNMALTGAVFTLLRNNAFNDKYEHKYVYVNNGYKNEKYAASDTEEHVHSDQFGYLYDEAKSPYEEHTIGEDFDSFAEPPVLSVSPEWLKSYAGGKMLVGKNRYHGKQ